MNWNTGGACLVDFDRRRENRDEGARVARIRRPSPVTAGSMCPFCFILGKTYTACLSLHQRGRKGGCSFLCRQKKGQIYVNETTARATKNNNNNDDDNDGARVAVAPVPTGYFLRLLGLADHGECLPMDAERQTQIERDPPLPEGVDLRRRQMVSSSGSAVVNYL